MSLGLGGGPSILMRYGDICEIFRFLFEIPNKKVFSEIRLRRTLHTCLPTRVTVYYPGINQKHKKETYVPGGFCPAYNLIMG